ncbi:uncharacterized protein J8A68_002196 [[Candida] subhashii]|uniref:Uncharacterized protein n=1 Tax=[Candida] subhashii TaxID=561895 RepID=A0A8J5QGN4_9ASCO|nr:uncharacterized protein J8A68_002196 [[Candida] subhashii]KAG7664281.1 hypothetical protein J8A68_002196 [[Candida] subhashii]
MTKLILEPGRLNIEFPNASVSKVYRVRIIGQVITYIPDESSLILGSVPTISSEATQEETLKINIFNQLANLSGNVLRKGAIVSVEGFYDGNDVSVVDIYEINGMNLSHENMKMLQSLNHLESLNK